MALVNITNVTVLDNPTVFTNPFQFEVEFECLGALEDDLEWKVTYVGSAEDQTHDQVLEEVMVGPVPVGVSKFVLQADGPDAALIPVNDMVGLTVVLITCFYREKEFVRIGYYVNNEYYHTSPLQSAPPSPATVPPQSPSLGVAILPGQISSPHRTVQGAVQPQPVSAEELQEMINAGRHIESSHVYRNILCDKPRVTRFQIDWTSSMHSADVGGIMSVQMGNEEHMHDAMEQSEPADELMDTGDEAGYQPQQVLMS